MVNLIGNKLAETKRNTNIYQLLHQCQTILAMCDIQGEQACAFSFKIAKSQFLCIDTITFYHVA